MKSTGERTELTVTEAAAAAGVERRKISRKLDGDQFPNAHRSDGKRGPGTGPWLIPIEDLVASGLTLRPPNPGRSEPVAEPAEPAEPVESADLDDLRTEVAALKIRAEVAEALARERERVIEAKDDELRTLRGVLTAGAPGSPSNSQPSQPGSTSALDSFWQTDIPVDVPPRRSWWQQLWEGR